MIVYLEKKLGLFEGKVLMSDDGQSGIENHEGRFAFVEAIEFLRK